MVNNLAMHLLKNGKISAHQQFSLFGIFTFSLNKGRGNSQSCRTLSDKSSVCLSGVCLIIITYMFIMSQKLEMCGS